MYNNRLLRYITAFFLIMLVIFPVGVSAVSNTATPYDTYTYWDDDLSENKTAVYTKDIYSKYELFDQRNTKDYKFTSLTDVCVNDKGEVYVLDGGSSRIFVLDNNHNLTKVISEIDNKTKKLSYTNAKGISCDEKGLIYISDTENHRVIVTDNNGGLVEVIKVPDSELIPEGFDFRPIKVTLDKKGYIYVLSDGSYYGALLYTANRDFVGFYGANTVQSSALENVLSLVSKVFMTTEKRALQDKKLPYQYVDLYIGENDFVYTCTGKFTSDTKAESGQIKKLNPAGQSVLGTDGYNYADDTTVSKIYGADTTQDLVGLAVDAEGYIYTVDATYGRVFVYTPESKLLGVFGIGLKKGEREGTFSIPCAIDVFGDYVYVCDSSNNNVTIFKITDYGKQLKKADKLTREGYYIESEETWNSILLQDGNCQLAYSGLAKASLYKEEFAEALKYAKLGIDRDTYAKAFEQVRGDFLAKNFNLIFILIIALVIALIVFVIYAKKKKLFRINNLKVRTLLSTPFHPFNAFEDIRYKNLGSVGLASTVMLLFYISCALESLCGGFLWVSNSNSNFNALLLLFKTVGFVILWSVVNWAVAALMGGIGKIKQIYIVICYSLIPMMVANVLYVILTNTLLPSEIGFLNALMVIATLYTIFLLIIGTIQIHDYSFGKFILTSILTLIGILIVIFIIVILFILIQQTYGFGATLVNEIITKFGGNIG